MNNKIYQRQFYILAFINVVTFKIGMLPSLLVSEAGSYSIFSMAIMMFIEMLMLLIIMKVATNGSLFDMNFPISIKIFLITLVFISSFIKLNIYLSESIIYIKNYIFQDVKLIYVLVPMIVAMMYIANKEYKSIARLSEIMIFVILATILFDVTFVNAEFNGISFENQSFLNGAVAIDKYLIWFCDFTPLLLLTITKPYSKEKFKILFLTAIVIVPLLAIIFFNFMYLEAGSEIQYAFSKLAVYNRISSLIGRFDLPNIIAFLIAITIKLSILFTAIVDTLSYIFKKRKMFCYITGIATLLVVYFFLNTIEKTLAIARSGIRYVVAIIEFVLPISIYLLQKRYKEDKKSFSSNLELIKNGKS